MRHTYAQVQAIASDMINSGANLRAHFGDIDKILHSDWEVPSQMDLDWIYPVVTSDPASAFFTAEKTLALNKPKIYVMPTNAGVKNEARMNEMEQWLHWQLQRANDIGRRDIVPDVVHSALRYDYICLQVIHLGHEQEANRRLGVDKHNSMAGTGDFAIRVGSPKNVYFKDSLQGLEAVLHVYETVSSDVIGTWGKKANRFAKAMSEDRDMTITVYDYTSLEQRMVWVIASGQPSGDTSAGGGRWKLLDEKWELPFINWVVVTGGTALEDEEEFSVQPLLGRIARTELWDLQNMIWTLTVSEAIATSAAPRYALIGPSGDRVRVEYHDPARLLPIPPGHTIQELAPRGLDEGLLHLSDRIKASMDRETVARFLQNLDLPDRAAYASINAVMQAAISALDRYKQLSERALRQMFNIMYWYVHYREETSIAFGGEDNKQIAIGWDEYDPEYLFIEVELDPLTPADYLQKINAGRQMQEMDGIPDIDIFKFLGFNNPEQMKEDWAKEQLDDFELQQLMKREGSMLEDEIMMRRQQMQMELQQAMQRQQQREQATAMAQEQEGGGRAFDPSAGGLPQTTQAPGDTQEMVTGEDVNV